MRELFQRKLKKNNYHHAGKLRCKKYSRSFPCGKAHGKLTWYSFTVELVIDSEGDHYIPNFFVSHHFGNKYSEHLLTDGAILRLHDDIMEDLVKAVDAFIYGED